MTRPTLFVRQKENGDVYGRPEIHDLGGRTVSDLLDSMPLGADTVRVLVFPLHVDETSRSVGMSVPVLSGVPYPEPDPKLWGDVFV